MPETDFLAFHAIDPVGRDVMVASLRLRIISREFDLVALDVIQIESLHDELKIELDASGVLWMRPAAPSQCSRSLSEARVPSRTGHLRDCVSRVMRVLNARVRPSRGGFTAALLDSSLERAEDLVSRDRFYEAACAAIESAVLGIDDPVLAGVPSARRSGARSNNWAWSHVPEVEGPQHAPKRNAFRDTHSYARDASDRQAHGGLCPALIRKVSGEHYTSTRS